MDINHSTPQNRIQKPDKRVYRKYINLIALLISLLMIISGGYIQLRFHINMLPSQSILTYEMWRLIHVISSVLFTVFFIYHIFMHKKWYKTVLCKRLFKRNRVSVLLTLLMIFSSISGFVPFIIGYMNEASEYRIHLIEIHDKVAVLFLILLTGHILRRSLLFRIR